MNITLFIAPTQMFIAFWHYYSIFQCFWSQHSKHHIYRYLTMNLWMNNIYASIGFKKSFQTVYCTRISCLICSKYIQIDIVHKIARNQKSWAIRFLRPPPWSDRGIYSVSQVILSIIPPFRHFLLCSFSFRTFSHQCLKNIFSFMVCFLISWAIPSGIFQ